GPADDRDRRAVPLASRHAAAAEEPAQRAGLSAPRREHRRPRERAVAARGRHRDDARGRGVFSPLRARPSRSDGTRARRKGAKLRARWGWGPAAALPTRGRGARPLLNYLAELAHREAM